MNARVATDDGTTSAARTHWRLLQGVRCECVSLVPPSGIGFEVRLFNRPWSRLRGCLGRDLPREDCGALLVPCDGVHSLLMHRAIDVAFVSETGCVGDIRSLYPGSWTRMAGAFAALELPLGQAVRLGLHRDVQLDWRMP